MKVKLVGHTYIIEATGCGWNSVAQAIKETDTALRESTVGYNNSILIPEENETFTEYRMRNVDERRLNRIVEQFFVAPLVGKRVNYTYSIEKEEEKKKSKFSLFTQSTNRNFFARLTVKGEYREQGKALAEQIKEAVAELEPRNFRHQVFTLYEF